MTSRLLRHRTTEVRGFRDSLWGAASGRDTLGRAGREALCAVCGSVAGVGAVCGDIRSPQQGRECEPHLAACSRVPASFVGEGTGRSDSATDPCTERKALKTSATKNFHFVQVEGK